MEAASSEEPALQGPPSHSGGGQEGTALSQVSPRRVYVCMYDSVGGGANQNPLLNRQRFM